MKKLELTLYKDFYPIDELRNFIASLCRRLGFDRNDVYRVKAAVDEAVTNVIRHSYKNKEEG
jgi:anti-sigma regulatory factor (Ser/Thr protein kinase)